MTDLVAAIAATVLLAVILALPLLRRRTPRPSAHTGYVADKDVLTRVETIDLALSVTTDRAQRDVLLDMRIRAVSS